MYPTDEEKHGYESLRYNLKLNTGDLAAISSKQQFLSSDTVVGSGKQGNEEWNELSLFRRSKQRLVPKKHVCDFCNKCFHSGCDLSRHVRTHTGEKPYKCHKCFKEFSIKGNLKRHMLGCLILTKGVMK